MVALGALALLAMLAAPADEDPFSALWPVLRALLYIEP